MKINGPGTPGLPPEAVGGSEASRAKPAGATGKTFTDRVENPAGPRSPAATPGSMIADITAELKVGALSPEAAIEKVLDRVLARQLGSDAPAPVREQVRAALREAIASDPHLAEKVRALTE